MSIEKEDPESARIRSLKDLIRYSPLATAFLIFLGFLNYDFYYRKLGVEIFHYLDTSELIFSIVKDLYPLAVLTLVLIIVAFFFSGQKKDVYTKKEAKTTLKSQKENQTDEMIDEFSWKGIRENLYCFFLNLRAKKFKICIKNFLSVLLGVFIKLLQIFLWVFGIYFGIHLFVQLTQFDDLNIKPNEILNTQYFILMSILWLLIVFIYSTTKSFPNIKDYFFYILVVMVFIANLNSYQNSLARNTHFDLNKKNICFYYNGRFFDTSNSLSLMGITKNYVFLRETANNENLVFRIVDLSDITIYTK